MKKRLSILCLLFFMAVVAFSQKSDTTHKMLSTDGPGTQFATDTTVSPDASPLDIGEKRGLYIITPDGKMQMRILGSVRYYVNYDMVELPVKKSFNSYFIPTGADNIKIPNYYNDLNQSRLGFEITRKLATTDVFIRLETDFSGQNGSFRIRHAYGQIGRVLVGRTWSLFSNVSSLPATVNFDGPTGSVILRTPQMRISGLGPRGTHWAVALEYSQPDVNLDEYDTLGVSTVQLIPDLTGRFVYEGLLGKVQFSGVVTSISSKDANNKVNNTFGIGGSLSGTVDLPNNHELLYQFTYGKAIAHFITTFSGTGNDAVFNPQTEDFDSQNAFGGFLSYGIFPGKKVTVNPSFGYAQLFNKNTQPDDAFKNSLSASVDAFWHVAEGARLGIEYMFGQRWDVGGNTGQASRISALFYYDF